jgi:hypothetical protein
MSMNYGKPRRQGGMTGELARKSRALTARSAALVRRVGGHSSMIRLSLPGADVQAWSQQLVGRAQTLAHWVAARSGRDVQNSLFGVSEFAPSVMPSA